jgi:imidazolonepropionase-like amidohydrolase
MTVQERPLVIVNGTVIDATGRQPYEAHAVVVKQSRIEQIVPRSSEPYLAPREAIVIDARGHWILPGLIDGHCHLSFGFPSCEINTNFKDTFSPEYSTLRAAQNAEIVLNAGVTSISVPGGAWFVDVAVREAIKQKMITGPRVFCAGRFISTYGSISDSEPSWSGGVPHTLGVIANNASEMITEVRRQCKHGVDLIKVADSAWGDCLTISRDELSAVVEEAHRRNVRVTIHARGAGATRIAAEAGVDWIMHGDLAVQEDLEAVAAAKIPIMPTLTALAHFVAHGASLGISSTELDVMKFNFDRAIRNVERMRELGIIVMSGTDTGNSPAIAYGEMHGIEAELLVNYCRFSPMEAIQSSTVHNAVAVGMEGQLGTVTEGKLADLILLDRNPLDDVSVLKRHAHLRAVIKDGKVAMTKIALLQLKEAGAIECHVTASAETSLLG